MKVEYINPFIKGVQHLFSTMLSAEAMRGDASASRGDSNSNEVTALIGMTGSAQGMVTIGLSKKTAIAMVNRMLSTDNSVMDDTVADGIAELVNIVAGQAKAELASESDEPIDLSLPTVVQGTDYGVDYPSDAVWLEVPFNSELGDFMLRVTFRTK